MLLSPSQTTQSDGRLVLLLAGCYSQVVFALVHERTCTNTATSSTHGARSVFQRSGVMSFLVAEPPRCLPHTPQSCSRGGLCPQWRGGGWGDTLHLRHCAHMPPHQQHQAMTAEHEIFMIPSTLQPWIQPLCLPHSTLELFTWRPTSTVAKWRVGGPSTSPLQTHAATSYSSQALTAQHEV
jgi:hypothetical protein